MRDRGQKSVSRESDGQYEMSRVCQYGKERQARLKIRWHG